ncbi:MAG: hypothetical protein ABSE53_07645 [Terracidiphilus sp.]|jgi:hypothetical protein
MKVVVFAEQFTNGSWHVWEHTCSSKEAQAVVDSALERTKGRTLNGQPTHKDFLDSARQMFDVTRGRPGSPSDADTQVYCVCADQVVIGVYEKIRQYAHEITEAHEFVEVALQRTA